MTQGGFEHRQLQVSKRVMDYLATTTAEFELVGER